MIRQVLLVAFLGVSQLSNAGEIAVLAGDCETLTVDEQNIVNFLSRHDYEYDCHTPGSIEAAGDLNSYKAIYARFSQVPQGSGGFLGSPAIPIIDNAVLDGTHLIMEYFGTYIGSSIGVGTAQIRSGDFTGFGPNNQRGIGDIEFAGAIGNDELLENLSSTGSNSLIVRQEGSFSGTVVFQFSGEHTVVDYLTLNSNSYHSELGGESQSTTSLPGVFSDIFEQLFGRPNPAPVPESMFVTAYQERGSGRVTSLGPHFAGAVSAAQIELGPAASQIRINALSVAGVSPRIVNPELRLDFDDQIGSKLTKQRFNRRSFSLVFTDILSEKVIDAVTSSQGANNCRIGGFDAIRIADARDFARYSIGKLARGVISASLAGVTTGNVFGDLALKFSEGVFLSGESLDEAVLVTLTESAIGYVLPQIATSYLTAEEGPDITNKFLKRLLRKDEGIISWTFSGDNRNSRYQRSGEVPAAQASATVIYNRFTHYVAAIIKSECNGASNHTLVRFQVTEDEFRLPSIVPGTLAVIEIS